MDEQVLKVKRYDPFDDHRWPLAQAAAWIIWRSRDRVAQLLSDLTDGDGSVRVFDIFNESALRENDRGDPPDGGVLPFVEAQAQLWQQLKYGRLVARGVKVGEATWSHIPTAEWSNLDYFPCTDGRLNAIGSNNCAHYHYVTVDRSSVLEIWPDIAKVKRGRKPKVGPDHIKSIVFDLLYDNGDIMDVDPEWRTQGDIERKTRTTLVREKFNLQDIPKKNATKEIRQQIS